MYADDSFFTLSVPGQIGLVLLSALLTSAFVFGFWTLTRRRNVLFRLAAAVMTLWLFVWLSPQVYYTYYLVLFDSLEFKNVIKSPPTASDMISLMTFSDRANFSNHGKGILGWGLVIASVFRPTGIWRAARKFMGKARNT